LPQQRVEVNQLDLILIWASLNKPPKSFWQKELVYSEIFASDKSFILIRIKGFSEKSVLNLKINREKTPSKKRAYYYL
jgi:hypothetical protein